MNQRIFPNMNNLFSLLIGELEDNEKSYFYRMEIRFHIYFVLLLISLRKIIYVTMFSIIYIIIRKYISMYIDN
jgi:hypothetical protein